MIKLDILSDPVCPWCFIGKIRLEQALASRPGHPFVIEWHPFQLNPDMPPGGMDRRDYLEHKFGSQQGAVQAYMQIDRAARESGIALNLSAIRRTPNTLDAHRLIHWAGIEGRQGRMVDRLFRAYFLEGQDIGDAGVLAALADEAGMDGAVVRRLLATDTDRQQIIARDARWREMGVRAVPTFIVGGQAVVPGARPPSFWQEVIDDFHRAESGQDGAGQDGAGQDGARQDGAGQDGATTGRNRA